MGCVRERPRHPGVSCGLVALTSREQAVCAEIGRRRDAGVELTCELIRFDTTARNVGDPPRDEAAMQRRLAEQLAAAGADCDLWEPSAEQMARRALVPPGL